MDIKLTYFGFGQGFDVALVAGDLETDEGLETAAIISLFSDALAGLEDELPGGPGTDRRGWWADSYAEEEDENTGSLLWLLERSKQLDDVLRRCKRYGELALAWMVEDEIARKVEAEAFVFRADVLGLKAAIYRPDGSIVRVQFDEFWRMQ